LNTPIRYLKGIGPKKAKIFAEAGINTVEDLIYYFPRRYEDRTHFLHVGELQPGETCTVKVRVRSVSERRSFYRRGFHIFQALTEDSTGRIRCVWFNQPYLKKYISSGTEMILYGRVDSYEGRLQMHSPDFEIVTADKDETLNTGRIVPVYTLLKGLSQRYLRKLIRYALDEYLPKASEFLPYSIRSRNNLFNRAMALINIHFPESAAVRAQAYERLSFEEFFLFQLPLALRKLNSKQRRGIAHCVDVGLVKDFVEQLPFKLTMAQEKVIAEIRRDMAAPFVMHRLLQGDVGSGKTVVATIAALYAIQGGYQVAFMVPTEILAKQHYEKISDQLSAISFQQKKIKVALLVGSTSDKEKERVFREIKEGQADLVIGTHALLGQDLEFRKLGLIVIDEQHKFGVGQRALLPRKGMDPDCLIMTATPIPRTLAITLYADMEISVINELPQGRIPVRSSFFGEDQRSQALELAKNELKKGNQVFVVYPVIEDSYALDIAGAKKMYEELKTKEFKEFRLGLIHGRLKQEEQNRIMRKFKDKELDVLVSTTVLEVGIDIPGATCMIIEHAERFGLAQLHQLRGRVGRGKKESFCVLVSGAETDEARQRMQAIVRYADGFRIAEEDLRIRGPGEFFGERQSGLSELKIANPLTQMHLLKKARDEASRLVADDPHFESRQNVLLKQRLLQRFPEYEKLVAVG